MSAIVLILAMVHFVLALLGKIPIICVLISPLLIMFIYEIMHFSFCAAKKNNDFSMIAGYKPTDSDSATRKQLSSIDLVCGIGAILCELLFVLAYYDERKMLVSLVVSGVYLSIVIVANVIANMKYPSKTP